MCQYLTKYFVYIIMIIIMLQPHPFNACSIIGYIIGRYDPKTKTLLQATFGAVWSESVLSLVEALNTRSPNGLFPIAHNSKDSDNYLLVWYHCIVTILCSIKLTRVLRSHLCNTTIPNWSYNFQNEHPMMITLVPVLSSESFLNIDMK